MKKNILHITNELNTVDGVTNHTFVLLNGLSRVFQGEIFIIAGGGNNTGLFTNTEIITEINRSVNHKTRSIRIFASAVKYVRDFVKKNNVGIIHSHNHYAANIARFVSMLTGVSTVQTNHGFFPDKGKLNLFNADYHIALNAGVLRHLAEKGIPEERIRLIKPGIPEITDIKAKIKNSFLAASRYSKEKGLDKYISASNAIESKYPGKFKFYIAGEGDEEKRLMQQSSQVGGAVAFVKDYKKYLTSARVFVFPSEAREGLPTVLLESVLSGCLVVSSAYEGAGDLFPVPFNGLLFKPGNAEELADKMIYAADNSDRLVESYRGLYQNIKKEYSVEKMVKEHLQLYGEILS
ncbi:MAG: glycosyltransferase family 4 protein [Bacteroidetes bacterium]|nr:glycosyltransferase family 4 protein [Bacteroidota bacterium]